MAKKKTTNAADAVRASTGRKPLSPETHARWLAAQKAAKDGGERGDHGRPSAEYEARKRREAAAKKRTRRWTATSEG